MRKAMIMHKNVVRTHHQQDAMLCRSSLLCSITEENYTTVKTAFLQKIKLQLEVVREGLFAASYDDRCEEQMTLVNQP
jgi:hypothetical protein